MNVPWGCLMQGDGKAAITVRDGKAVGRVRIDSATSLWRAAEYGDLGRLKMLLDAGHDINAFDESAWRQKTPLSAAVDGNEPLAVRLLLRRGANPNLRDGDGDRYPLHWASAFGDHDECAELLVQAGAVLDARDVQGLTPLEFARRPKISGGRSRVEAVLATAETAAGERTPWSEKHAAAVLGHGFWKAAASGDVRVLEQCLKLGQPIDQPRPAAKSRMSALALATYNGRQEAMAFLIGARADVNAAEGEGGFTPLHFCAHDGDRPEAARLLLEAGADPTLLKKNGESAHDLAKRTGRKAVEAVLWGVLERQRAESVRQAVRVRLRPRLRLCGATSRSVRGPRVHARRLGLGSGLGLGSVGRPRGASEGRECTPGG